MATFSIPLFLACFTSTPSDSAALIDALRTAHGSNRDAIQFGTVRFRYTVGQAADADAAVRGEFTEKCDAQGFYVFDGPNARYERVNSAADIAKNRVKVGKDRWSSSLDKSLRILTDGELTLWDQLYTGDGTAHAHTSQIFPGSDVFYREALFPLGLGNPHPPGDNFVGDIDFVTHGEAGWRLVSVDPDAKLAGREVVHLTVEAPQMERHYWIDLERGAVPLIVRDLAKGAGREADRFQQQTSHDDLKYVHNQAWVPFRTTHFVQGGLAKQLAITEANFETSPDRSQFRLEFPEPKRLINTASMVRYPPQKVWDLSNLPSTTAADVEPVSVPSPKSPPPAMPAEREARPWWVIPLLSVGAVLVLAAVVMIALKLRRSRVV